MILTGIRTFNFIFFCFFFISGCHESHDGYPHLEFQRRRADASNGESGQERGAQVLKFARDFTCFTGTKVQILTLRTLRTLHTATSLLVQKYIYWRLLCWYKNTNTDAAHLRILHTATSSVYPNWPTAGTQFTCFTGKKLPILTLQASRHASPLGFLHRLQVLSLLALLVQQYKYWRLRSCAAPTTAYLLSATTEAKCFSTAWSTTRKSVHCG